MKSPELADTPLQATASAQTQQDLELVQAILRRDRKATAEFVAIHTDSVYGYIRRRVFPRLDLVDDLVQDVFVAALGSLRTFSGTSSLRTWLLGIARHKVEDHYRKCLSQPTMPFDDEADVAESVEASYDEVLDRTRRHERVQRVLAGLPDVYRIVLQWRYWEKRSARDMARAAGKTEKAIERLLARARHEFRRRWNEG
jgi:RNA polymerase sigma-70 factor (ECF subfamily)